MKWNKLKDQTITNHASENQTEVSDERALFNHYTKHHIEILRNKKLELSDAFGVIFIEQPDYSQLDIKENYWISKLGASINIAKTFLPKFK